MITRRQFGQMLGAGAITLAMPLRARAQSGKAKVVIIGGGAGGASAARHLANGGGDKLEVTLIQEHSQYTTCFYSNLYLGGFRDFDSITHGYDKLASDYGVKVVHQRATAIDRGARTVTLADGESVAYDRLVVAPGIDLIYDSVPGYSEQAAQIAPHAWQAGEQTQLLKAGMDKIENGQSIVMVPPPNPYRCPPGPYERASMMAHSLTSRGLTDSRIIILDPKPKFSKQGLFQEGWEKHYPGMIEWYSPDVHGGVTSVDAEAGLVETDLDSFKGALLNIIPGQRAGAIAVEAGLTDDSGFCPTLADSMRSKVDDNVYVIGDASIAGAMPKSGFSANSQAKVAAAAILTELAGAAEIAAQYSNTCWSLIATDDGVKVGAVYAPEDGKIAATSKFVSQTGEDAALRKTTYEESIGWYDGMTADMFG